jgi:hypothetical protein
MRKTIENRDPFERPTSMRFLSRSRRSFDEPLRITIDKTATMYDIMRMEG